MKQWHKNQYSKAIKLKTTGQKNLPIRTSLDFGKNGISNNL